MSHIIGEIIKDLSVDCVIFGFEKSFLEILLVKRAIEPEKGKWALPGGFIKKEERIKGAAKRVLCDTTGLDNIYLEEIAVFDQVDRFPLWRVLTIGYFALISPEHYKLSTGVDTIEVKWFKHCNLPDLPFDHKHIIDVALNKLRTSVKYKPIGFELLPKKFTLPQLQILYEVVLGRELDKRNFRKKIMKMDLLKKLNEKDKNNIKRRAHLYHFDQHNYSRLKEDGFIFEL